MRHRLQALDWMRGIVMILMATDHASGAYNARRLVTDSAFFYTPGMPLPTVEFLYRWASHLCAPTFVFLAGTSLALSVHRRRAEDVPEGHIDRDLFLRGLLILSVDLTLISWLWLPGSILLQVMYAIGGSMLLMIPARRLPSPVLIVLALLALAATEWLRRASLLVPTDPGSIVRALLFEPGMIVRGGQAPTFSLTETPRGVMMVGYPLLPWWAMMAMGWSFGAWLVRVRERASPPSTVPRLLWTAGSLSLAVYLLVRGLNGFGNLGLPRYGPGLLQWLHASKYPPSISFTALELGLMAILLGFLFRAQENRRERIGPNGPVLVFGQTAFFFYLVHIVLLELSARGLGVHQELGLGTAVAACIAVLIVLYPLCRWYRGYKAARPESWLRFF